MVVDENPFNPVVEKLGVVAFLTCKNNNKNNFYNNVAVSFDSDFFLIVLEILT